MGIGKSIFVKCGFARCLNAYEQNRFHAGFVSDGPVPVKGMGRKSGKKTIVVADRFEIKEGSQLMCFLILIKNDKAPVDKLLSIN
jgi:hypothetical protein